MRNQELSRQLQRIAYLVSKSGELEASNLELVSHWAKYLCVTCAGFLENALREIYGEYARNSADTSVARYVYKQLDRIQNPNTQKFLDIAYQFDDNWGRDLEAFVADESRKSAIDTIMANRNLIAHGRDVGITVVRVKDYLDRSVQVLEFIEKQCQGN